MKVVWGKTALADLKAITEYISKDNHNAAVAMFGRFRQAVKRVGSFPMSGRIVPEYNNDKRRETIVGAYRVLYKILDERVEIDQIVHGASPHVS